LVGFYSFPVLFIKSCLVWGKRGFLGLLAHWGLPVVILVKFVILCNKEYVYYVFIGSDIVYHKLKDLFY